MTRKITLDAETADRITIDTLKQHYPLLKYKGKNQYDKEWYREIREAFQIVLQYYGEDVK